METCKNCPLPRRCLSAERCIVYKEGAVAVDNPQPKPHPVSTTSGTSMTGAIKKIAPKKKVAKKKVH